MEGGFPLPTPGGGLSTGTSSVEWGVSDGQKGKSFSAFPAQGVPTQGRGVVSSAEGSDEQEKLFQLMRKQGVVVF